MRVGLGLEELGHPTTALGRIDGVEAGRKWASGGVAGQSQGLDALQQRFDGPAKPGPEFHLSRDGSFEGFTRQAGVEHQGVGKFHRLTHSPTVALRYPMSISGHDAGRGFQEFSRHLAIIVRARGKVRTRPYPGLRLHRSWLSETGSSDEGAAERISSHG